MIEILSSPSRWLALACCVLLLVTPETWALNGKTPLTEFHHDSWTAKDGAPGDVTCLAQTADGWLWIGSSTGLYRFDGIRFTRFVPPAGEQMSRRPVTSLTAVRNGDLLVGYMDGTPSLIHDGHVRQYPSMVGQKVVGPVYNGLVDADGTPWLATSHGLLQLRQGAWSNVSADMGLPAGPAINLMLDQYGQIWVGYEDELLVLDRTLGRFRSVLQGSKVVNLIESPDGRLWLDTHKKLIAVPAQHGGRTNRARCGYHRPSVRKMECSTATETIGRWYVQSASA